MQLLLNIFLCFSKCVAASRNISMFFNERAASSEKILTTAFERKMCNCFLEFCPLKKYFEKPIKIKMMKRYTQKPMTFMYFWLN